MDSNGMCCRASMIALAQPTAVTNYAVQRVRLTEVLNRYQRPRRRSPDE